MRLARILTVFALLAIFAEAEGAGPFDTLRTVPAGQRVKLARVLYKKEFRRADSVTAFAGFKELFDLAAELKDKPLEVAIYELQSDYFSVNRGDNPISPAYIQKAIDRAVFYDLPVEAAVYTYKMAMYYYNAKHYVEAHRYFLEAYDMFKAAGPSNVPDINIYLSDISTFYYIIGDLKTAQTMLHEALTYNPPGDNVEIGLNNTLALTYQRLDNEGEALKYFTRAMELAHQYRDSTWIGIVSDNLGTIYFNRGQYDAAREYLTSAYKKSLKSGEVRIAAQAMLYLAKCSLAEGDMTKARELLNTAEPMVKKVNELDRWIMFYEAWAQWHERQGDASKALDFWKKHDLAKDSLDRINNEAAVTRVKLQWEIDKHKAQVEQLHAEASAEVIKRNGAFTVLFLLMVISVLAYSRLRLKRRQEKELFEKQEALLQSEKTRAEEELYYAVKELHTYTENLRQKNELIEQFKKEIESLQVRLASPAEREKIDQLEKLMEAHIMTDDNWIEFKRLFEKVHRGFLARLKEKIASLTESDVRLLTLVKLGLGNREMANMLGVTLEAIKKSRQRLRKKVPTLDEQTIEEFVSAI
jgi:tetratricopeptide (TPR) repeat protein